MIITYRPYSYALLALLLESAMQRGRTAAVMISHGNPWVLLCKSKSIFLYTCSEQTLNKGYVTIEQPIFETLAKLDNLRCT